jgi:hypothetical protein
MWRGSLALALALALASTLALACGVTVLIPAVVRSQTIEPQTIEIRPGDSRVHGERLRPFTNQWKMKVVRADGSVFEDAGIWTDQLEATLVEGRHCWKRVQLATFKRKTGEIAATTRTVNVFDAQSMAPISREFERHIAGGEDSKLKITFHGNSMKVEKTEKGKTEVREVATTEAFDFYGGVYALLWVALPLQQDFVAAFPSYTEEEQPELVQQVPYKVTGRETMDGGKVGKRETWIVESDSAIGYLKYWISGGAPYIIRMDFKDKSGATWILTMK